MEDNQNQPDNQQGQHRPLIIQPTNITPEQTNALPIEPVQPVAPVAQTPLTQVQQQPMSLASPPQVASPAKMPTAPRQVEQPQQNTAELNSATDELYDDDTNENYEDSNVEADIDRVNFSWVGPEFVMVEKSSRWFMGLFAAVLILGGLIYLVTRDFISVGTIVIAIILLGTYSLRRPKNIAYNLNDQSIGIGKRRFLYSEYKHFTVNQEGNYVIINFVPLKRFSLPVGACCRLGSEEDQVINYLSLKLPYEQHKMDMFDSIIQRMHL
jgi:hypothetical protein